MCTVNGIATVDWVCFDAWYSLHHWHRTLVHVGWVFLFFPARQSPIFWIQRLTFRNLSQRIFNYVEAPFIQRLHVSQTGPWGSPLGWKGRRGLKTLTWFLMHLHRTSQKVRQSPLLRLRPGLCCRMYLGLLKMRLRSHKYVHQLLRGSNSSWWKFTVSGIWWSTGEKKYLVLQARWSRATLGM